MNSIAIFFLRQFLLLGLLFSTWTAIGSLITDGAIDPFELIFQFVFCGLIVSWILVHYHIERIKNLGFEELSPEILSSKQERVFTSQFTQKELIDAILNDPVLNKLYLLQKDNEIILRSGSPYYSLGTIIKFKRSESNDGDNMYKVVSQPRYYFGLADSGKSLEYITQVEKMMGSASLVSVTS